jgi:hypothetical protein
LEPQVRVVMSVQGFAAACQTMQRAMTALVGNGTIVTKPARTATPRPARKTGQR